MWEDSKVVNYKKLKNLGDRRLKDNLLISMDIARIMGEISEISTDKLES